jgi:hypothetical protein
LRLLYTYRPALASGQKKDTPKAKALGVFLFVCTKAEKSTKSAYAWAGAPTGQVASHAPHSMQTSASITNLPSPSEMAETGHSAAQAPQEIQSSEI